MIIFISDFPGFMNAEHTMSFFCWLNADANRKRFSAEKCEVGENIKQEVVK